MYIHKHMAPFIKQAWAMKADFISHLIPKASQRRQDEIRELMEDKENLKVR